MTLLPSVNACDYVQVLQGVEPLKPNEHAISSDYTCPMMSTELKLHIIIRDGDRASQDGIMRLGRVFRVIRYQRDGQECVYDEDPMRSGWTGCRIILNWK